MKHVSLTCINHPHLRWSTKECACSNAAPGQPAHYNGSRNIFFAGRSKGTLYSDKSGVECEPDIECHCNASDLIIAPENPDII